VDDTITTTYYLCEEFLKATGHRDDPQTRLSTAEVMTIALTAAAFFGGNIEASRSFLDEYGYIKKTISKSRFNRRLHAIDPCLWQVLFDLLAEVFKQCYPEQTYYVVDSLPVAVCDNIRIRRCKLYPPQEHGEAFRGYIASKRRYFYGLRVHLVTTEAGEPVEFCLAAASEADISIFKEMSLELPEGSIICADKGYTDYHYEDLLEEVGLHLKAEAQEEIQTADACMGGVFEQAHSPVHRDGLQQAEHVVFEEDPRGDAQRFRAEDRLLPASLLHSVLVGGNSG
jgi:Transposase DDE domain